jgi:DNA-binding PadR family transcriptional regulator
MTSGSSADRNGHDQRSAALDLSSIFGAAAAGLSRRRLRPRRTRTAREPEEPIPDADELATMEPDPVEPEMMEDAVHDQRSRRAPAEVRTAAPAPGPRHSDAAAPRRRFGVVKVRDRQHVDMLLLAAATAGPANGRELIDRVRERSDGLFVLPLPTVIRQLHRLANNRLMRASGDRGARRYLLTPLGERVLATRLREWEAFSHGLDSVLDAAGDLDDRRDDGPSTRVIQC